VNRVQPDSELWDALEEMDRDGVNQLPVMSDSRMMGMLSRENLIGLLKPPFFAKHPCGAAVGRRLDRGYCYE
jgi:signal-transduction protein with cAMP-binding, CBS, and nucleotidyltransferase domain